MAKTIQLLLICCGIFIATIASGLLYLALQPDEHTEKEVAMCGNVSQRETGLEPVDGKAIFQVHCASCHSITRDAAGPGLVSVLPHRNNEWLCKFLTSEKFFPKDSRAIELRNTYRSTCLKFPKMTCEEVESVFDYVGVK